MRKNMGKLSVAVILSLCAGTLTPLNVQAAVQNGWEEIDGKYYWYENGVRQGYDEGNPDYRGKEIYDPDSDAWYWLDNVQGGAKAVNKDVYQESEAGVWGDIPGGDGKTYGKWVHYNADGHMVKGWDTNGNGTYYFDLTYGTMAKGETVINDVTYFFNKDTGILESVVQMDDDGENFLTDGWHNVNGTAYWYEGGVRQGVRYNENGSIDTLYRGKEIYDPDSDAWYWLDNVQNGAVAKSKDVYQESEAGDWGDIAGEDGKTYGKWVRYDENGHMVKGWQTTEAGTYYFDLVYGTMAKGLATVDDADYYFDPATGVMSKNTTIEIDGEKYTCGEDGKLQKPDEVRISWIKSTTYNSDGSVKEWYEREYDADGNIKKSTNRYNYGKFTGGTLEYDAHGNIVKQIAYVYSSIFFEKEWKYDEYGNNIEYTNTYPKEWYKYEYDAAGNKVKEISYSSSSSGGLKEWWNEYEYDANGNIVKRIYNSANFLCFKSKQEYTANSNIVKIIHFNLDNEIDSWTEFENDADGNRIKDTSYNSEGEVEGWTEYENDADGNRIKAINYNSEGEVEGWTECENDADGNRIKDTSYNSKGDVEGWTEYENNADGNPIKSTSYNSEGVVDNWTEYKYENSHMAGYIVYNSGGTLDSYRSGFSTEYDYTDYISNGVTTSETLIEYEYDGNGNKVKCVFYDSDGISGWSEYEYDVNGNMIKYVLYYPDGTVKKLEEYDANGNMVKNVSYYSDGTVSESEEYNTNGNKIKYESYYPDGTVKKLEEYDANGNMVKYMSYGSDGIVDDWEEYEYDTNGNTVKHVSYNSDGINVWIEYKYNSKGDLIKEINYNSDGTVKETYQYDYQYDEYDNMVLKICGHNGESYVLQKIEYRYE